MCVTLSQVTLLFYNSREGRIYQMPVSYNTSIILGLVTLFQLHQKSITSSTWSHDCDIRWPSQRLLVAGFFLFSPFCHLSPRRMAGGWDIILVELNWIRIAREMTVTHPWWSHMIGNCYTPLMESHDRKLNMFRPIYISFSRGANALSFMKLLEFKTFHEASWIQDFEAYTIL